MKLLQEGRGEERKEKEKESQHCYDIGSGIYSAK